MRLLIMLVLSVAAGQALAQPVALAGPFGKPDVLDVDFGSAGEFYALRRTKEGVESLSVHVTENTSVQYSLKPEAGFHIRGFKLLPQRRFAYVLGHGEGKRYQETLYVVHLSSRQVREVLTADSVRFPEVVPADLFGFQVLRDHPGRRPQTHLLSVDYSKGHGDTLAKLPGRCELLSNPAGQLTLADCLDATGKRQYLRAPTEGKSWRALTVPDAARGGKLVGTFLNGDLLFEQRPKSGGARLLRLAGNTVQELSVSQSRTPDRYLRSFDHTVIIGAVWLTGEPSAELLDVTHPDVQRYLEWSIKHTQSMIEVLGRSADQRLTLVAMTRTDQPKTYELWHRDEQLARRVGVAAREAYAPGNLMREPRQLALRDGRLRDGFVTKPARQTGRLAVVMADPAPSWGFAPFALSLTDQGFTVLELGSRAALTADEQAEDLIDALKWARNLELADDRPACLFADAKVLAAASPKLYALATDCQIALPAGSQPEFAADAEPMLRAAVDNAAGSAVKGVVSAGTPAP